MFSLDFDFWKLQGSEESLHNRYWWDSLSSKECLSLYMISAWASESRPVSLSLPRAWIKPDKEEPIPWEAPETQNSSCIAPQKSSICEVELIITPRCRSLCDSHVSKDAAPAKVVPAKPGRSSGPCCPLPSRGPCSCRPAERSPTSL